MLLEAHLNLSPSFRSIVCFGLTICEIGWRELKQPKHTSWGFHTSLATRTAEAPRRYKPDRFGFRVFDYGEILRSYTCISQTGKTFNTDVIVETPPLFSIRQSKPAQTFFGGGDSYDKRKGPHCHQRTPDSTIVRATSTVVIETALWRPALLGVIFL